MKKNYFMPATKVVTVNVKAICNKSFDNDSEPVDTNTTTEAPLF